MTHSIARTALLLALGSLLALTSATPADAAKPTKIPHTCNPKGSKTFKNSKYVRVFRAGREYRYKWRGKHYVESSAAYFSCDRNTKRWVLLFDDGDGDSNPPSGVTISGHWLIILGGFACSEGCDVPLVLFNAVNTLTGRTIDLRTSTTPLPPDYKTAAYVDVGKFAITSDGVAVFGIRRHYRTSGGSDGTRTEIVKEALAPGGPIFTLLDSGDGIDIRSLALTGRSVTWMRDGTLQSGVL